MVVQIPWLNSNYRRSYRKKSIRFKLELRANTYSIRTHNRGGDLCYLGLYLPDREYIRTILRPARVLAPAELGTLWSTRHLQTSKLHIPKRCPMNKCAYIDNTNMFKGIIDGNLLTTVKYSQKKWILNEFQVLNMAFNPAHYMVPFYCPIERLHK